MRIFVDFDGTLFDPCFQGIGEPIPGARAFMFYLKAQGHYVVIYSTRASKSGINSPELRARLMANMKKALDDNMIMYDEISEDKPPWDILIDDRCICFKGSYGDVVNEISRFNALDWSKCDGETDHTFNKSP